MTFYKYHGAGNDFLIADGRDTSIDLTPERISSICDRHTGAGADGVMILERDPEADFRMRYYNSDGSGGMMCGNGGRCIVAFAADLGYAHFLFNAPDGQHVAEIVTAKKAVSCPGGIAVIDGSASALGGFSTEPRIVRLKMRDVENAIPYPQDGSQAHPDRQGRLDGCDWFLDTGTRHLVRFVVDVADYDVTGEGRILRHDRRFAPAGVNVNFVQVNVPVSCPDGSSAAHGAITVRTFEKGVEDETLACGTGIVASALATWLSSVRHSANVHGISVRVDVRARISDLSVTFTPELRHAEGTSGFRAKNIWLEGPATYVCRIEI